MLSAVYRQRRPPDEVRHVGDHEKHRPDNVPGLAQSAHRNPLDDLLQNLVGYGLYHLGIDVTGRNGIDGNAQLGAFLGECLGETVDARLGRGVVDLAILAGLAIDRTDIHDTAELLLTHALDDGAAEVEAGGEIRPYDVVPLLEGHLVESAIAGNTCVVDQHLHGSEPLCHRRDPLLDGIEIPHIELERGDTGRLLEGLRPFLVATIIGGHFVSGQMQCL